MGGIITVFNGTASNIPTGWYLCDGSNGTPNLVDRFVKGAVSDSEIGMTGGDSHSHTLSSDGAHSHSTSKTGSHRHTDKSTGSVFDPGSKQDIDYASHDHTITSEGSHAHTASMVTMEPPYYKLCYIMSDELRLDFPIGSIVMFAGLSNEIPRDWVLCDGNNGTLDLRGRFIRGASTKGSTGGSSSHAHGITSEGSHTHSFSATTYPHTHPRTTSSNTGYLNKGSGSTTEEGPSHIHSLGSSGSHAHTVALASNDPPYYKLAFIQKVA